MKYQSCILWLWGIAVAGALVLPVDATGAAAAAAAAAAATASSSSVWAQAWEACKSLDARYFVAGGTCAAISHGITTPIDVVKTKIQAQPQRFQKMSIPQAAIDIIHTEGPPALLGGLGPTLVGYGIEGAMKFGIYEVMKPVFAALLQSSTASGGGGGGGDTKGVAFLLASVVAGAVAALFLCPMESTRIRMVTDPAYQDLKFVGAWTKLIADEGLGSTFEGVWAMISKQVPYTFGKQVSFDVIAKQLYIWLDQSHGGSNSPLELLKTALTGDNLKFFVSITSAFLASLVACLFSQPGDMIVTETYKEAEASSKAASPKSFPSVVSTIYQQGGLSEFFRGTGARIVHVGLIITSQLVIYDLVKQMLGLPATGSH